ncbi:hypothetical protein N7522_002848 [Penicillium canescens]|uniref:Uncharacterized protein n=1 Tax=Penicillium canescens TaxID=5083 RepID=A0AAD6NCS4_PENCN|nr:uncharacterized protein N7446_007097 [Penicillium canescens]KAJ6012493.1 hypothetical protein N7522_002848 [Penicillium canescens]KAJ6052455.1 hypothetical protein N7460_002989 [Penicillium canescens]KAJ6062977.1 hypothetical protein N7446_007097 [Penicillium canescens]
MAQQRLRMSDIFPDPNEDESPLALDEAARALYRRAIDNPSSLTDEERRTVTPQTRGRRALSTNPTTRERDWIWPPPARFM